MGRKQKFQIKRTLIKPERRQVYLLKSSDGSQVVLKIFVGTNPWMQKRFLREKIALDALQGLAVPKRIKITHKEVANLIKEKNFYFSAVEHFSYPDCYKRAVSVTDALGIWAFTLEQLCAFRRRQVLYTDMKDDHIMLSKDHTHAVIIDFNDCVLVEPSGQYPFEVLGVTPELAVPEFYFSRTLPENAVVYQAGMLLGSLLNSYFRNVHLGTKEFDKIRKKLFRAHAQDIFELFKKSVSKNSLERPQNFEVLFSKLLRCSLPVDALKLWTELRKPYQKPLSKLGFGDPKISHRLELIQKEKRARFAADGRNLSLFAEDCLDQRKILFLKNKRNKF